MTFPTWYASRVAEWAQIWSKEIFQFFLIVKHCLNNKIYTVVYKFTLTIQKTDCFKDIQVFTEAELYII
jgi:hypothetical protein